MLAVGGESATRLVLDGPKKSFIQVETELEPPPSGCDGALSPPFPGPGTFIPPGLGGGAETPREGGAEGEARSVRGWGASLFTPREGGAEIPPGEVGTGEGGERQLRRNLKGEVRVPSQPE